MRITSIYARTNQYFISFLPSSIRDWNSHPEELRNSVPVSSFTFYLNQVNDRVPKYYYSGDRRSQILHTRLCTKCCLNYDIYLKNLTDPPLCRCGDIENSQHYFLYCYYYYEQRNEMLHSLSQLCNVSLDVLLFGNSSLSVDVNTQIFAALQKFIRDTKRI